MRSETPVLVSVPLTPETSERLPERLMLRPAAAASCARMVTPPAVAPSCMLSEEVQFWFAPSVPPSSLIVTGKALAAEPRIMP